MKSFGPKKFQIPWTDQKVPFWQFFRKGHARIVQPSRIPHRISKIGFVLGSYEFLVMLEGPILRDPVFKGSIFWNYSVLNEYFLKLLTCTGNLQRPLLSNMFLFTQTQTQDSFLTMPVLITTSEILQGKHDYSYS